MELDVPSAAKLTPDLLCTYFDTSLRKGLSVQEAEARERRGRRHRAGRATGERRGQLWQWLRACGGLRVAVLVGVSLLDSDGGIGEELYVLCALLAASALYRSLLARSSAALLREWCTAARISIPVTRGGEGVEVAPDALVPGDVFRLLPGGIVPATARVVQVVLPLRVDQASLTGEREPVAKHAKVVSRSDPNDGRYSNVVYPGTHAVEGDALCVVLGCADDAPLAAPRDSAGFTAAAWRRERGTGLLLMAFVTAAGAAMAVVGRAWLSLAWVKLALAVAAAPAVQVQCAAVTACGAVGLAALRRGGVVVNSIGALESLSKTSVVLVDPEGVCTVDGPGSCQVIRAVKTVRALPGNGAQPRGGVPFSRSSAVPWTPLSWPPPAAAFVTYGIRGYGMNPVPAAKWGDAGSLSFVDPAQVVERNGRPASHPLEADAALADLAAAAALGSAGALRWSPTEQVVERVKEADAAQAALAALVEKLGTTSHAVNMELMLLSDPTARITACGRQWRKTYGVLSHASLASPPAAPTGPRAAKPAPFPAGRAVEAIDARWHLSAASAAGCERTFVRGAFEDVLGMCGVAKLADGSVHPLGEAAAAALREAAAAAPPGPVYAFAVRDAEPEDDGEALPSPNSPFSSASGGDLPWQRGAPAAASDVPMATLWDEDARSGNDSPPAPAEAHDDFAGDPEASARLAKLYAKLSPKAIARAAPAPPRRAVRVSYSAPTYSDPPTSSDAASAKLPSPTAPLADSFTYYSCEDEEEVDAPPKSPLREDREAYRPYTFLGFAAAAEQLHDHIPEAAEELASVGVTVKVISSAEEREVRAWAGWISPAGQRPGGPGAAALDLMCSEERADAVHSARYVHSVHTSQREMVVKAICDDGAACAFVGRRPCDLPSCKHAAVAVALPTSWDVVKLQADVVCAVGGLRPIANAVKGSISILANAQGAAEYTATSAFSLAVWALAAPVLLPCVGVQAVHLLWVHSLVALVPYAFAQAPVPQGTAHAVAHGHKEKEKEEPPAPAAPGSHLTRFAARADGLRHRLLARVRARARFASGIRTKLWSPAHTAVADLASHAVLRRGTCVGAYLVFMSAVAIGLAAAPGADGSAAGVAAAAAAAVSQCAAGAPSPVDTTRVVTAVVLATVLRAFYYIPRPRPGRGFTRAAALANPSLTFRACAVPALHAAVLAVAPAASALRLTPLSGWEWCAVFALAVPALLLGKLPLFRWCEVDS